MPWASRHLGNLVWFQLRETASPFLTAWASDRVALHIHYVEQSRGHDYLDKNYLCSQKDSVSLKKLEHHMFHGNLKDY